VTSDVGRYDVIRSTKFARASRGTAREASGDGIENASTRNRRSVAGCETSAGGGVMHEAPA